MKPNVLVVDDERDMLTLLDIELSKAGYRVATADTGREGIQMAQSVMPDVILMDIMLPDLNGADAVKILQSNDATRHIPIMFLTALMNKDEEGRHRLVQVNGHYYESIAKPIDPESMLKKLHHLFEKEMGPY